VREQHLRRVQSQFGKARFPHLHEAHLPDGRCRLQLVHRVRAPAPAQALHAFGDRTGRNDQHLDAALAKPGDLARPVGDGAAIEALARVGEQARADLHDDAPRIRERGHLPRPWRKSITA
jgi:hypothetical protein